MSLWPLEEQEDCSISTKSGLLRDSCTKSLAIRNGNVRWAKEVDRAPPPVSVVSSMMIPQVAAMIRTFPVQAVPIAGRLNICCHISILNC